MVTLRKTVTIPVDRRIRFDLTAPEDIPPGEVEVTLIIAAPSSDATRRRREISGLAGALAGSPALAGDLTVLQREWRDEW